MTLTIVGSVGSLANGGSGVIMGPLQDKVGFKPMYSTILVVMFIVYSTIPYIVELNAFLYSVWVVAAFLVNAAQEDFPYYHS